MNAASGDTTKLDTAFVSAMAAKEDGAMAAFYDALAATMLFMPIEGDPEAEDAAPMALDLEGGPTLLVFDTEQRLAEFVDQPTGYAAAPGRTVIEMAARAGAQIGVNLGPSPSATLLPVDVVAWIAEALTTPVEIRDLSKVLLSPPEAPDAALLEALAERLAEFSDVVVEGWLVSAETGDSAAGLALILLPVPGVSNAEGQLAEALSEGLARAVQYATPGEQPPDLALVEDGSQPLDIARRVGIGLHAVVEEAPAATPQAPGSDPAKPPKLR